MSKSQKWIFRLSIAFNIVLILIFLLNEVFSPSYKLGVLKKNINVGIFTVNDSTVFTLPKGLTVRDVSERGLGAIGQFENNRFDIIITSDDSLVDYSEPVNKLAPFGNYYSIKNK